MRITTDNRLHDNGVSLYILIQLTDSGARCVTAKSTVATVHTLDGRWIWSKGTTVNGAGKRSTGSKISFGTILFTKNPTRTEHRSPQ
jgi:hypothetical protein